MTPEALKVITDALREAGLEEQALWLEHPELVQAALSPQFFFVAPDGLCAQCQTYTSSAVTHQRKCKLLQAWIRFKHPQAERELLAAWEEAEAEQVSRVRRRNRRTVQPGISFPEVINTPLSPAVLYAYNDNDLRVTEQVARLHPRAQAALEADIRAEVELTRRDWDAGKWDAGDVLFPRRRR